MIQINHSKTTGSLAVRRIVGEVILDSGKTSVCHNELYIVTVGAVSNIIKRDIAVGKT